MVRVVKMMCVGGEDERVIRVMCVGVHSQLYSKYFEVDIDYQPTNSLAGTESRCFLLEREGRVTAVHDTSREGRVTAVHDTSREGRVTAVQDTSW